MIFDDIKKAIDTGATIEIEYTKPDGTSSVRKLSEVAFSSSYGPTYIEAFCHMRNGTRTFKIGRISKVTFLNKQNSSNGPVLIMPTNSNLPYQFNGNKRIFKLYGEDYNY